MATHSASILFMGDNKAVATLSQVYSLGVFFLTSAEPPEAENGERRRRRGQWFGLILL